MVKQSFRSDGERRISKKMPLRPTANRNLLPYFMGVVIAIAVFLVYGNTLQHGFHFDDLHAIQQNHEIRDPATFRQVSFWTDIHNRPLAKYSFALNYQQGELKPAPYHRTNILIHTVSALLVFLSVLQLFRFPRMRNHSMWRWRLPFAFAVAMLFALHPVQVQAVTYIVQRMTSMAWMFALASLLAYLSGRLAHSDRQSSYRPWIFYALALLMWLAAMLTKQEAAALPLILLAAEFFFVTNKDGKRNRVLLIAGASLLFGGGMLVAATGWIPPEEGALSPVAYFATQMKVILKYWQISFIPVNLTLDYAFPHSGGFTEPMVIIHLLIHLAILAAAILIRDKNPLAAFGILLFYLPLATSSTIFPIRDVIFEHRMYLSVAGFAMLLMSLLLALFIRWRRASLVWVLAGLWIVVLGSAALERNKVWRDTCTLWEDALRKSPGNSRAWLAVADCLKHRGDTQGAFRHYEEALRLNPENVTALNNRGNLRMTTNDLQGAINDYTLVISISPEMRNLALLNRGMSYMKLQEYILARNDFDKVAESPDPDPDVYMHRGLTYVYLGDLPSAIADFGRVLDGNPAHQDALFNMANTLMNSDRIEEAVDYYSRLLQYNPGHSAALHYRGVAYLNIGKRAEACADLKEAASRNYPPSAAVVQRYCGEFVL